MLYIEARSRNVPTGDPRTSEVVGYGGRESEEESEVDEALAIETLESFEGHEINLECASWKLTNYEIVIDGLGWIGVQGMGFATVILHLP